MKIAIVTAYFQPEFGYEEFYVSRILAKLGHEVSVITSDRIFPFKNIKKLLAEISSEHTTRKRTRGVTKLDGVSVYRLPSVAELFADYNIILNIGSTLKKIQPDIVHLHEPIQGGIAVTALHKKLGFKLVVEQHAYSPIFGERNNLKNNVAHFLFMRLRKPAGNLAFSRADAITAINEESKRFMVKVQGLPADKIQVIPLGTETDVFNYSKKLRKKFRAELGTSSDEILILTAGRLDRAKKLEQLIQAFNKLQKKINAKLVIIGSGDDDYALELQRLVEHLKLQKKVQFIKFVKKTLLPGYFSAADIGFWNKEAITIIEAMSCTLPVVLPDQVTVHHYITNDNGLFFADGDVSGLHDKLFKLASDNQLRSQMGERARELVKKRFSYDVTTKKYLKIYKKLLND